MDEVLRLGPFDRLLDLPGIDGPEDIFGNISLEIIPPKPLLHIHVHLGVTRMYGIG